MKKNKLDYLIHHAISGDYLEELSSESIRKKLYDEEYDMRHGRKPDEPRNNTNPPPLEKQTIKTNSKKLVFTGKKNQLLAIFFELKEKNIITSSNELIAKILCDSFEGWENSYDYALKVLEKNSDESDNRKPKSEKRIKLKSLSNLTKN